MVGFCCAVGVPSITKKKANKKSKKEISRSSKKGYGDLSIRWCAWMSSENNSLQTGGSVTWSVFIVPSDFRPHGIKKKGKKKKQKRKQAKFEKGYGDLSIRSCAWMTSDKNCLKIGGSVTGSVFVVPSDFFWNIPLQKSSNVCCTAFLGSGIVSQSVSCKRAFVTLAIQKYVKEGWAQK